MPVHMTERAAQEFKNLCKAKAFSVDKTRLRLEAKPTSEKGKLSVVLRLDDHTPRPDDVIEVNSGAQLVVNKTLDTTLGEARIDYQQDQGGFVVEPL